MSLNRLHDLCGYLSGPIDFDPTMGKGWRDDLTEFLLPLNVKVLNPLKHVFYGTDNLDTVKRPKMKKFLESGQFSKLREEVKSLNHWDLRSVDLSSFLIVYYPTDMHMCGTIEEMTIANKQSKPVLIMAKNGKKKLPTWLYGRFPHQHMFETWEELKAYISRIDHDAKYRFKDCDKKRWLFFDGEWMRE